MLPSWVVSAIATGRAGRGRLAGITRMSEFGVIHRMLLRRFPVQGHGSTSKVESKGASLILIMLLCMSCPWRSKANEGEDTPHASLSDGGHAAMLTREVANRFEKVCTGTMCTLALRSHSPPMSNQSDLIDEFKRQAHAERGKVFRDPEPAPSFPLVPISIAAPDGSGGEVTEVTRLRDRTTVLDTVPMRQS